MRKFLKCSGVENEDLQDQRRLFGSDTEITGRPSRREGRCGPVE
jgi:hypothetical protein